MNERQFMQDVYDVLCGNTQYITQEQFSEKYHDLFVEINCDNGEIKLSDDHNEWRLQLQKIWCDATKVDTADSPLTEALQYVRENMDEDDKEILKAEVSKCYKMHLVPNSQLVDCSQVIDLMEEYADEHDLPESWWEEYADIDEILNKLLEE